MTRMLVTSFNQPGNKLAEALLFKREALASGLVDVERTDELLADWSALPNELRWDAKDPRGVRRFRGRGTQLFSFLDLSKPGWPKLLADFRTELEAFLAKLYASPVDVYVVGGHHTGRHLELPRLGNRYCQSIWGLTRTADVLDHVVAIAHPVDSRDLVWVGDTLANSIVLGGVQQRFAACRMILVLGCNALSFGEPWQLWAKQNGGLTPLVLGWDGPVFMRGGAVQFPDKDFASFHFWSSLKALVPSNETEGLAWLWKNHPDQIAQAWGAACWAAYHDSVEPGHRWLWCQRFVKDKKVFWRRAAARLPDGTEWVANPKYNGKPGQKAMVENKP